jgi:aminoglycoside phosphotransferase (APT) family kinase protein
MDPVVVDLARAVVTTALGRSAVIARIDPLQRTRGAIVLRVTLSDLRRLVLKVADGSDRTIDFERTQAVIAVARAAGVPAPAVLAANNAGDAGRRYLLLEHVEGVPWRHLRSTLDPSQVAAAHQEIAAAVLSLQSVELPSFGEIDHQGQPAGRSLLDALRHRAELRIVDGRALEVFHRLLDRSPDLFTTPQSPTLCHDDLHHGNLLFRARSGRWELAGVLDWDKAWAGPAESDIARMEFWDDMTGPAFWRVYHAAVPAADGYRERSLIYQLLWCLEYTDGSLRHAADTAALAHRLGLASSDISSFHHLTLQESS